MFPGDGACGPRGPQTRTPAGRGGQRKANMQSGAIQLPAHKDPPWDENPWEECEGELRLRGAVWEKPAASPIV